MVWISLIATAVCGIHEYGPWKGGLLLAVVYAIMPYRPVFRRSP